MIETLLARALSAAGRREEALAVLRQATGRRPALPQAFLELGDQLGALGRFDEAAAAFEAGLAAGAGRRGAAGRAGLSAA